MMRKLLGFLLLVAIFGFGGALAIVLALGLGVLIIKLIPVLLVAGLVSMIVKRVFYTERPEYRRDYW